MAIVLLTFGATFGGAVLLFTWIAIRGYRLYREAQVVTCPENGALVAVKLHVVRAAAAHLTGNADLRLKSCSRWPEKRHCGQECVSQIKAAPGACSVRSILAKSYRGAHCALCNVEIGQIGRGEHTPVLMSPDRMTRIEWDEVPPQELPKILSTHSKICWNCHMEESFRALRPSLAAGDPARRVARRSAAS
jgi:hypothetical protein